MRHVATVYHKTLRPAVTRIKSNTQRTPWAPLQKWAFIRDNDRFKPSTPLTVLGSRMCAERNSQGRRSLTRAPTRSPMHLLLWAPAGFVAVLVVVGHEREVAILVAVAVVVSVVDVLRRAPPVTLRLEDGVDPQAECGRSAPTRAGPCPGHALCLAVPPRSLLHEVVELG